MDSLKALYFIHLVSFCHGAGIFPGSCSKYSHTLSTATRTLARKTLHTHARTYVWSHRTFIYIYVYEYEYDTSARIFYTTKTNKTWKRFARIRTLLRANLFHCQRVSIYFFVPIAELRRAGIHRRLRSDFIFKPCNMYFVDSYVFSGKSGSVES